MQRQEAESPCPHRIVDECGGAFLLGCVGGGLFHFGKGMRNAPKGQRLWGGYVSMVHRAPSLGGGFAVWGGLFATYNCILQSVRQKEDIWNPIAAGTLVGGTLAARAGVAQMGKGAMVGGVLLAVIEGLMYGAGKLFSPSPDDIPEPMRVSDAAPSMLEGLTGGGNSKGPKKRNDIKDVMDDVNANYALDEFIEELVGFDSDDQQFFQTA